MKYILFFLVLTSLSFTALSKNIKFEVLEASDIKSDLKEVCKTMGGRYNVMINIDSVFQIDCMGKKVNVNDFCQKKYEDSKKLLRGVILTDIKKAVCQFGEGASLRIECQKKYFSYCKDSKKSCGKLRKIYANRLSLFHSSIILDESGKKVLRCQFISSQRGDE